MADYRILALDGGGIRGLVTTILLERLTAEPGLEDLLDRADLLAGTSTGGLLALAIARGIPLARIRELYVEKGPRIFDDSWLDDLLDLGKISGADYDNRVLRRELGKLFGAGTLGDLPRLVLVPTFDLDSEDPARRTWKPKLFHNFPGEDSDGGRRIVDVALYTTAAPTYFPSVDGYIDGGVYANNPSMCALAQCLDARHAGAPSLGDVRLFSLGTGQSLEHIPGRTHDWGYAQWVKPLIRLMLDGVAGIADYQCRQILLGRYERLAPEFPPGVNIPMDAVDRIDDMVAFARSVPLERTLGWLRREWA